MSQRTPATPVRPLHKEVDGILVTANRAIKEQFLFGLGLGVIIGVGFSLLVGGLLAC